MTPLSKKQLYLNLLTALFEQINSWPLLGPPTDDEYNEVIERLERLRKLAEDIEHE